MKSYPRDVMHTLNEKEGVENFESHILVGTDDADFAKKSYFLRMSLIGRSSAARDIFLSNSQLCIFKVVKNINAVSR